MPDPHDGTDLPDHDYAAIYGAAMLAARQAARWDQHLQAQAHLVARLDALITRLSTWEEQLQIARRLADAIRQGEQEGVWGPRGQPLDTP